jgi:hypothetical protein
MIPIFSRKYENLILDRGFVRIFVVFSSVGIYLELYLSLFDFISNKLVFDLNVLRPFMKHWMFG